MPQFKIKIQNEGDNCQLIVKYRDTALGEDIIDVTFENDIVNIRGRVFEIFVRKDAISQKFPLTRRSLRDSQDPRNINRILHHEHFLEPTTYFTEIIRNSLSLDNFISISIKAVEMSE